MLWTTKVAFKALVLGYDTKSVELATDIDLGPPGGCGGYYGKRTMQIVL